jgi:glucose/arabinose dehydrogenase
LRWTGGRVDRWTGTATDESRRAVRRPSTRPPVHLSTLLFAAACASHTAAAKDEACDRSITLPPGFCALVFADTVGPARHIVVRSNGDVYVGVVDQRRVAGGVVALRDTNKDGHADLVTRFGETGVHGLVLQSDSTLLASTADQVLRYRLTGTLGTRGRVDTVISGLAQRPIPSHSLAIDFRGNLLVNIGANSDGCATNKEPGAPGANPCPELETSGGIWKFKLEPPRQTLANGTRIATGLHNAVALTVSPFDSTIIAVSHGRDGLHEGWPSVFSEAQAAEAAGEELVRIASSRADFGWPYCYYDYLKDERLLAPEYGGDGRSTEHCDHLIQPLVTFPAHWSPMSILFYTGTMFPPDYRGGAFIAFHGSSYRRPMPEDGYEVIFLHFKNGQATTYAPFVTGLAGGTLSPTGAAHRAVGLAQGPDGALYLTDDKGGRIWKIVYRK